jgi:hypothetical protein
MLYLDAPQRAESKASTTSNQRATVTDTGELPMFGVISPVIRSLRTTVRICRLQTTGDCQRLFP